MRIWKNISQLSQHLHDEADGWGSTIVLAIGTFYDPTLDEIRYLQAASKLGKLVVTIDQSTNCGTSPIEERMEFLSFVRGVSHVASHGNLSEAIRLLKPNILAIRFPSIKKNRFDAEIQACLDVNCEILLGVGGKTNSSS